MSVCISQVCSGVYIWRLESSDIANSLAWLSGWRRLDVDIKGGMVVSLEDLFEMLPPSSRLPLWVLFIGLCLLKAQMHRNHYICLHQLRFSSLKCLPQTKSNSTREQQQQQHAHPPTDSVSSSAVPLRLVPP